MSCELQGEGKRSILPTKLVATATSLEGSKNNSRSFIYGQRSTNPANFVKIGAVDVELIGVTKTQNIFVKQQQNKPSSSALRVERVMG